jgi:hypothetical protein
MMKLKRDSSVRADLCVCPCKNDVCPFENDEGVPLSKEVYAGTSLHEVVRWFKTMTTNAYIRGVKQKIWPSFNKRLWHRNYYDRIIRNNDELHRIREYILNNPMNWEEDEYNPNRD